MAQLSNGAPAATPRRRPYIKDALRYKTVLCDKFVKSGTCPYGRKCQFAHGAEELRARIPSESDLCQPVAPVAWQSLSPSAKSLSSSLALSPTSPLSPLSPPAPLSPQWPMPGPPLPPLPPSGAPPTSPMAPPLPLSPPPQP